MYKFKIDFLKSEIRLFDLFVVIVKCCKCSESHCIGENLKVSVKKTVSVENLNMVIIGPLMFYTKTDLLRALEISITC